MRPTTDAPRVRGDIHSTRARGRPLPLDAWLLRKKIRSLVKCKVKNCKCKIFVQNTFSTKFVRKAARARIVHEFSAHERATLARNVRMLLGEHKVQGGKNEMCTSLRVGVATRGARASQYYTFFYWQIIMISVFTMFELNIV